MNKLQKRILNEETNGGSRDTSNASNETTSATTSITTPGAHVITKSSDAYDVGAVAVPAIGFSVFFAYSKKSSQIGKK